MKKRFLVGNFMRAYSGAFRYAPKDGGNLPQLDRDWLEVRFRERAARARLKKQRYVMTLQIAAILAIAVPLAAVRIDLPAASSTAFTNVEQEVVTMQEIAQTMQQTMPPPPPRPPVPIAVADDELPDEVDLDFDATLDIDAIVELPPPPAPSDSEEDRDIEPEIFVVVEDLPEIIGGVGKLAAAVKYPPIARQAQLEGLVVVKIVVNADGTPSDPEILKSPGSALDNAAIDAVMQQQFKPGRQRGRAVAAYMAIPVRFQLTSI